MPTTDLDPDFMQWKTEPTPFNLGKLVNKYSEKMGSEIAKYDVGNLPTPVVKSYGKKFIIDAIKTYDPSKGSLRNYIATNLQKMHRVNYETSSSLRMSEELQRGLNLYKGAIDNLAAKYNRPPTTEEVADELSWTPSKVARTAKQAYRETLSSKLEFAPATVAMEDPRLDYIYYDLDPGDKLIFQHRTGYKGAPVMGVSELAKKLKTSPGNISNRAAAIAKQITEVLK